MNNEYALVLLGVIDKKDPQANLLATVYEIAGVFDEQVLNVQVQTKTIANSSGELVRLVQISLFFQCGIATMSVQERERVVVHDLISHSRTLNGRNNIDTMFAMNRGEYKAAKAALAAIEKKHFSKTA